MTDLERRTLFEDSPVHIAVLHQILPAIAAQMVTLLYNLADTYFVGLLNNPSHTAAVTVSYSPFMLLTVVSNLFGIGGASSISRALGRKESKMPANISSVSFWFGSLSAFLYGIVFVFIRNPVLRLCGATDEIFELCEGYALWVILLGGIPTVMNQLLANLIRSDGNARTAAFGTSLGGIINILLDPIFVLPRFLGLGAIGAGIATAVSNLISAGFLLLFLVLKSKSTVLSLNPRLIPKGLSRIHEIFSSGIPSAIQIGLTVVAVTAMAKFVSFYGTKPVAAFGIVKKIDQLPLFFSIGVANGMMPLLAYNYASGNSKRRRSIFRFGTGISVSFSITCLIIYELFAPSLTGFFIKESETVSYASRFLRIMVIAMPLMAYCYPMIIQFQAMKKSKEAVICSILRKGTLDIPLLFLMNKFSPLYGCMFVQPIVDFISLIVSSIFYQRILNEEKQTLEKHSLSVN